MNLVAFICNIAFIGFFCLVLLTDGIPRETAYIVFTLFTLLVPILSSIVIFRSTENNGWLSFSMKRKALEGQRKIDKLSSTNPILKIVAIICNIVLVGLSYWAFVSQYPHPKEEGFLLFIVILFLTPILSSIAILRSGADDSWLRLP